MAQLPLFSSVSPICSKCKQNIEHQLFTAHGQLRSIILRCSKISSASFPGKQSLIEFSGFDAHGAGGSIFPSPSHVPVTHQAARGDRGAPIQHSPTSLRADNYSKPASSHRILVDALLRWPSPCLNGFQAVMWNESFVKSSHSE